ncbi:DUF2264 domain-containing protein [Enterococcus sp. LJL90]
MINPRIRNNPFETYQNVAEGFKDLMQPLDTFFDDNLAGQLPLGSHGTVYFEKTRNAEAFLRPLWGLGPYLTQNDSPYLAKFMTGIAAGTDPDNPNYWGQIRDYDQLIVEMASLSSFLLLNKAKTWDCLTQQQQNNLHAWLIQVNDHSIPKNNWYFFRVLVNVAMKKFGMSFSQQQIEADLAYCDSFYVGKGWYYDGVNTQYDYYISFAIHYYSLLYTVYEPEDSRNEIFKERAIEFAQSFKHWFDSDGEALPFGRSLTYRFSQVSFFSALVFANVEALPWGEIKGLISRHMHNWLTKEIFTPEGLLSVGYHYQNLVFAEGYNGPGSPYWAFKTFLILAVPQSHPYWQVEVLPLNLQDRQLAVEESRNFYQHNQAGNHLLAFPAGQFVNYQVHPQAKYSKFVYSSKFGFSTPKSNYWYYEGGFDSILALAEDDHYFRTKSLDVSYEILSDRIIHQWQPWEDVQIKSTIIPLENCHLRIHEIENARKLYAYEGGFSTPMEDPELPQGTAKKIIVENSIGTSEIESIYGFEEAAVVRCEPNTNLLYPLTVLPYLKTQLAPGTHLLVSLVSGRLSGEEIPETSVTVNQTTIQVSQGETELTVKI